MMTEAVKGKSVDQAKKTISEMIDAMRGVSDPESCDDFGDLMGLKGVAKFPVRVKCATLSWHALENALNQDSK